MSRFKPIANTYTRPMQGWWRHNPYFLRYMLRESSAVFLAVYAIILLLGLNSLSRGEAAYNAWRAALGTPVLILFHVVALLAVSYHSFTWFQVMPKTAPRLPFNARLVTAGGLGAAAALSVIVLAVLRGATR
jgi:fumarate reductase subunit C